MPAGEVSHWADRLVLEANAEEGVDGEVGGSPKEVEGGREALGRALVYLGGSLCFGGGGEGGVGETPDLRRWADLAWRTGILVGESFVASASNLGPVVL